MRGNNPGTPLLWLVLLISACAGEPTLDTEPSSEFPGLFAVSNSGFREAWASPDANLTAYRVIEIGELDSASAEVVQPASSSRIRREWVLTPERQAALARVWREAMTGAAERAGLDAHGAGDQVLVIKSRLTRIAPRTDVEQVQQTPGVTRVYTEDSGEAAIQIRLYDGATGRLLVVIRDKRRIGPRMWGLTSTVSVAADVRSLFNTWSNQLLSRVNAS